MEKTIKSEIKKWNNYDRCSSYHWFLYDTAEYYKNHTDYILKYFSKFIPGSIVDVGCGDGLVSYKLNEIGFNVTGIDINNIAINVAKEKCPEINFILGNYMDNKFNTDYLLASSVVEFFSLNPGAFNFISKAYQETEKSLLFSFKDKDTKPTNAYGYLEYNKKDVDDICLLLKKQFSKEKFEYSIEQTGAFIYLQIEK